MGWQRRWLVSGAVIAVLMLAMSAQPGGARATHAQDSGMQASPCGDFTEADETITVAAGSEFTIALAANPTTGYSWELGAELDGAVLELVGSQYMRGRPIPGAGGTDCWTFYAVAPGEAGITLNYRRPWETDVPPAKTLTFTITVVE